MSDIQAKLGDGLSKLKGGIEQGKQRLQVVTETNELRKKSNEAALKKSKILLEMGLLAHNLIRTGEVHHPELAQLSQSIVGFDQIIYQSNRKIKELQKSEQGYKCECGAPISEEDKFCGGCGKKVTIAEEQAQGQAILCAQCGEEIPEDAQFCVCCGVNITA